MKARIIENGEIKKIIKELTRKSGMGVAFTKKALQYFDTYKEALEFASWASKLNICGGVSFDKAITIYGNNNKKQ